MSQQTLTPQKTLQELEDIIQKAIKKVKGAKENDLCKYLPGDKGGYIHHFTMRKMKVQAPEKLKKMINERINDPSMPKRLAPRPRAARGSRKRRDQIVLTRPMLERILNVARLVGDKEMITMLSPKRPFATLKRDLIASIRQDQADMELWSAWQEATSSEE
ncbi:MAG: hypothetical protein K940chlam8_00726 [Chlamydiae bacterium]|nr:hypothetical protein [Chlamydiota bacterium]